MATIDEVGTMGVIMVVKVGKTPAIQLEPQPAGNHRDTGAAEIWSPRVLMEDGSVVVCPHLVHEEREPVLLRMTGVLRNEEGAIAVKMFQPPGRLRAMRQTAVTLEETETCHLLVGVLLSENQAGLLVDLSVGDNKYTCRTIESKGRNESKLPLPKNSLRLFQGNNNVFGSSEHSFNYRYYKSPRWYGHDLHIRDLINAINFQKYNFSSTHP
jgi:hypothetical protein